MPEVDVASYIVRYPPEKPNPTRKLLTPEQVGLLNYFEREVRPRFAELDLTDQQAERFSQLYRALSSPEDLESFRALYHEITDSHE